MNGRCGCGFLIGETEVRQRQIEPALSCLEAPWEDNIVKTAPAGPLVPCFSHTLPGVLVFCHRMTRGTLTTRVVKQFQRPLHRQSAIRKTGVSLFL